MIMFSIYCPIVHRIFKNKITTKKIFFLKFKFIKIKFPTIIIFLTFINLHVNLYERNKMLTFCDPSQSNFNVLLKHSL